MDTVPSQNKKPLRSSLQSTHLLLSVLSNLKIKHVCYLIPCNKRKSGALLLVVFFFSEEFNLSIPNSCNPEKHHYYHLSPSDKRLPILQLFHKT